ncbi:MAG: cysteine-rich CWC family protein [Roseateles sp.]|uniref:cysteine-rich CWC family protein n=1 Tax=Roseateles sp. TaxID=1971397 RepID=UPI0039E96967
MSADLPGDARCPRCGGGFACGAATGHCACFGLRLSDALRAELAARYRGCLCLACLRALAEADAGGTARPGA